MNFFTKTAAATAVALVGLSASAFAMTFPTFVIDESASSIDISTNNGFLSGSSDLTAVFSAGVDGFAWTPTSATDSVTIGSLIDWTATGTGVDGFDVTVELAFSAPDASSATSNGSGGFGTITTFFGQISGGVVSWVSSTAAVFAQGSTIELELESGFTIGGGGTVTSGGALVGNTIAPVPLPAGGLLLISALAGLGIASRRRKKANV